MKYKTVHKAMEQIDHVATTEQRMEYFNSRLTRIRAVTFDITSGFDASHWISLALTRSTPPNTILFRAYMLGDALAVPISAGSGCFGINIGFGSFFDPAAVHEVGYWGAPIPDVFWEGPTVLTLTSVANVTLGNIHFITDHSLP